MTLSFKNNKFDLWTVSKKNQVYDMVIRIPKIAKRVNAVLHYYSADTKFTTFEDTRFRFSAAQIKSIATTHRNLAQIFRQLGCDV